MLVRLRTLKQMSTENFVRLQHEYAQHRPAESRKQSGGDFYNTLQTRNSHQLVSAVTRSVASERLLYRDAADILDVKVNTIPKLVSRLLDGS